MSVSSMTGDTAGGLTEDAREFDNVVHSTAEACRQRPETNGRRFSDDNPRGGRRTQSKPNGDDEAERRLRQVRRRGYGNRSCDTQAYQENSIGEGTPKVDLTSTEVGGQDPRKHDEDPLEG